MNLTDRLVAAVAAGTLLVAPLGATAATMGASNAMTSRSTGSADTTFAAEFAMSGANEMALARLALTHSKNARVLAFARKMIADHTKAGMQLQTVATQKSYPTPMKPDATGLSMSKQLMGQTGASFDAMYKQDNVIGHQKALALLQVEVGTGKDAALVAYAKKQTPIVQTHLTMAQALPST